MRIDEYTKEATSKIYNPKQKRIVSSELEDHMLSRKEFNIEIGYDDEKAESMAVERMGDAQLVIDEFSRLHSDSYNPTFDIIIHALLLCPIIIMYYFLYKYTFCEIPAMIIAIGGIITAVGLYMLSACIMMKKAKIGTIIINIIYGATTGVFIDLVSREVGKRLGYSIENAKNLVLDFELVQAISSQNKGSVHIPAIIFSAFALILVIISIILCIKFETQSNTLSDNHFKNGITKLFALLFVVIVALGIYTCTRYFSAVDSFAREYRQAYLQMVEISESCSTEDEVNDYLKSHDLVFKSADSYSKNFVNADFCYSDSDDFYFYIELDAKSYCDNNDTMTARRFRNSEGENDALTKFGNDEHTNEEIIEFVKAQTPSIFKYTVIDNPLTKSSYMLRNITGNCDCKYQTEETFYIRKDKYFEYKKIQNKAIDIIKANPKASFEELAKLTGAKLIKPEISFEEYKKTVNMLGSFFDKESLLKEYEYASELQIGNLKFKFQDSRRNKMIVYYIKSNTEDLPNASEITSIFTPNDLYEEFYVDYVLLNENAKYSTMEENVFKKVLVFNKGYYAKNKLAYDYDKLPYFTSDGTRYTYHTENEDPGDMSGYIKHHYLVSQCGEKHEDSECYIDKNGYLVFDKAKSFKLTDDGYHYKDAFGSVYTRAFETSWDENGELIDYTAYEEK